MRTPSPRRRHHDVGFSDTVSNVVEIQKEEHKRGRHHFGYAHRHNRGISLKIHTDFWLWQAMPQLFIGITWAPQASPINTRGVRLRGALDVGVDVVQYKRVISCFVT